MTLPMRGPFNMISRPNVLMLVILWIGVVHGKTCPANYEDIEGYGCYLFGSNLELTWFEAYFHCDTHGGVMAEIRDEQHQSLIMQRMSEIKGDFWIGLADFEEEGSFKWTHSDLALGNFTAWSPLQPDGGGVENCVGLNEEHYWFWTDDSCELKKQVLCWTPTLINRCGDLSDSFYVDETNRCYVYSESRLNFTESLDYCDTLCPTCHMAELTTKIEVAKVLENAPSKGSENIWLAFTGTFDANNYTWIQADTLVDPDNWRSDNPRDGDSYLCGEVIANEYTWKNYDCRQDRYTLCEFSIDK